MKKLISILAALAVVTTCSAVGFAADFEVPAELTNKYEKATKGEDAGLYVVDLATVAGDQDQTTILAVKGDTISVGTIEYIGQSADTTFKFDLRNTLAAGETVYVLAGGSDIDAQVVGYMAEVAEEPEVEKITISGTVSGWAGSTLPTVKIYNGEAEVATAEVTAGTATGVANYTVEVDKLAEGSYTLKATKTSHLSYTKATVAVADDNTAVVNATLAAGDVNSSGLVDFVDLSAVIGSYEAVENDDNYTVESDIDESKLIDFVDLSRVIGSYEDVNIVE